MPTDNTIALQIHTVDAFTKIPFKGNPAAVCVLPKSLELQNNILQNIASEMNISETAFIREIDAPVSSGSRFGLRWFTPTNEVDLCGHATLASAATLFYCYGNENSKIEFETKCGLLLAEKVGDNIGLTLPLADTTEFKDYDSIKDLLQIILGPAASIISDVHYSSLRKKLLIRLPDTFTRDQLEAINVPDASALIASVDPKKNIMGVILTMKGTSSNDCVDEDGKLFHFVSRYFAPWNGIPEDPVTGAAHTVLGNYWSGILGITELYARQCSPRGGNLTLKVHREDNTIFIGGPARVVLKGELIL